MSKTLSVKYLVSVSMPSSFGLQIKLGFDLTIKVIGIVPRVSPKVNVNSLVVCSNPLLPTCHS